MKKNIGALITVVIILIFSMIQQSDVDNIDVEEDGSAFVTHIVDGDTFDIATGERVRMIGIDTPERGKYFYKESSDYLAGLIDGKNVILVKDVSEADRYGRILRHVYYDDEWINEQMIEEGFAKFVTFPPDVMHVDFFAEAQESAREQKRGLWADK